MFRISCQILFHPKCWGWAYGPGDAPPEGSNLVQKPELSGSKPECSGFLVRFCFTRSAGVGLTGRAWIVRKKTIDFDAYATWVNFTKPRKFIKIHQNQPKKLYYYPHLWDFGTVFWQVLNVSSPNRPIRALILVNFEGVPMILKRPIEGPIELDLSVFSSFFDQTQRRGRRPIW